MVLISPFILMRHSKKTWSFQINNVKTTWCLIKQINEDFERFKKKDATHILSFRLSYEVSLAPQGNSGQNDHF